MQKALNIPTTDKKIIYGKLEIPKAKSKGLIIFIHGLTWDFDHHMYANGAKYFTGKWFTTYRFNLYGDQKQARKLKQASLKNHIQDVNTVSKYFQKKWIQNIFLIGHSFGGLTILYAKLKNITWIILRDPSIGGKELLDDITYHKQTNKYSIDRWDGVIYHIWSNMYKDFLIDSNEHLEKIKKITLPIQIICAEKWLQKAWKKYYKAAKLPKDFTIIPWATHCFDEKWTEKQLFTETYKRVKKYS